MKSSSPWISGDSATWDNGQAIDLDANGWVRSLAPGQIARKLMLRAFGDKYPAGQYVVHYDGQGTLNFKYAAQVVSRSAGQIVLQVSPTNDGLYMEIAATDPTNYIRNIRITTPGGICKSDPYTRVDSAAACANQDYLAFADNPGLYFNPEFLTRLRGYSVLRFMDWMGTNSSPVTSWSQRTPLGYSTWATTGGVPAEVMVMLANVLHARPWFNMPAKADDGYISSFAQLVSAQLDPSLVVYVEDSNEVWNSQFGQYAYESQQAAAQSPTIDVTQFHALRTHTIGQTFKAALGANRVVTVLGAQAASTYTASHGLDYLRSQFGASSIGIDAVAIAPYIMVVPDPSQAATFDAMTLDQFFAYVQTQVLPQALGWVANYHTLANNYGVHLISYEGGQHMVGHWGAENDATLNTLFDAFNRDPRTKQLYLDYLAGWRQNGGELFVHFSDVGRYDKWGRWGALEYLSESRTDAPKYDGLQTFIEQNPVWWTQ